MTLEQYFLELAEIDNVHPNEDKVLDYIKDKLKKFDVPFGQDDFGNIVAKLKSIRNTPEVIGLSGHVDIAAPLKNRKIVKTEDYIKTDGTSILGGDDKTAVAAMLKLAETWSLNKQKFKVDAELIFTVGEESGLQGAKNLDYEMVEAKDILVFDWSGPVNHLITRSPAYIKLDVEYIGKSAHPAQWQNGINAGQYLMRAAGQLEQGEFKPGVTLNIGKVNIGEVRNQVPSNAKLLAEVRSFDYEKARKASESIRSLFKEIAEPNKIELHVEIDSNAADFMLDKESKFCRQVIAALDKIGLKPKYEETYGCFDGNVFAKNGKNVIIMGAGFYNPHSPDEYVNRHEFAQMYEFINRLFTV